MPKTQIDYSNTVIYKLVHQDDISNQHIYIGSTTNFKQRKSAHKSNCNQETSKESKQSKYVFIRENGGWEKWRMIEIEKYPCDDKREAENRERYWIEFYKCKLNYYIPTRTNKEWRNDNLEYMKNYEKSRNIIRKEYNQQRSQEYYENNKTNILDKRKDYYETNSEKIKQNRKMHYDKNKDILNQKSKEKITCSCGCKIRKSDLSTHQKTKKHMNLIKSEDHPTF